METKKTPKGLYFLISTASPFFHAVIASLAVINPSRWAAACSSARRLDWRRAWVVSPLGLGLFVEFKNILTSHVHCAGELVIRNLARFLICHPKNVLNFILHDLLNNNLFVFCFHRFISLFDVVQYYHRYITLSRVNKKLVYCRIVA